MSILRGGSTNAIMEQPEQVTWSPQDLTSNAVGFLPIPDEDYVKQYQRRPELWPVEFFLIAYRRRKNKKTGKLETQVLVRRSANGTSKYGVGTGVPATRWVLSTPEAHPPLGYKFSEPPISFDARHYPEFPTTGDYSWSYSKIDIREDAFNGPDAGTILNDPELEEYAGKIREGLRARLSKRMDDATMGSWEAQTTSVVASILGNPNSVAAIQGTLRMSGLFQRRDGASAAGEGGRYVGLDGEGAPDLAELVRSTRIYTMFPQMPDPMPLPSTPAEELQQEIATRDARMAESGRDPHKDAYGRRFTHRSTSNVSNTIHGVYLILDTTDLPGLDEVPPALDLFGAKEIAREWVSLQDLKVLDADGESIGTEDTKPTFISGFIVRQLVAEGVVDIVGR